MGISDKNEETTELLLELDTINTHIAKREIQLAGINKELAVIQEEDISRFLEPETIGA